MRWPTYDKYKEIPGEEVRTIHKYLWLPKCLDGEWRWCEIAAIKQGRWTGQSHVPEMGTIDVFCWIDRHWED